VQERGRRRPAWRLGCGGGSATARRGNGEFGHAAGRRLTIGARLVGLSLGWMCSGFQNSVGFYRIHREIKKIDPKIQIRLAPNFECPLNFLKAGVFRHMHDFALF
jgi:hypothetical protein